MIRAARFVAGRAPATRGLPRLPRTRGTLVLALLFAGFSIGPPLHAQPERANRPNVVLIITDDLGYGDLGSYGAPDIRTPNIDGLARDGVRLTDFYANAMFCTPTRAALITGRYQQRVGLEVPLGSRGPALELGLPASGRSLPQLLRDNGYATALIGKWHLGYKPEYGPNAHGFDHFFGLESGCNDYWMHTNGSGEPDLWENESAVRRDGYMTDLITERAVAFIEENVGRPFFIDVAYMLFDLETDIGERVDVAHRHTDVVRRLVAELEAWEADVDAERVAVTGGAPTLVIENGRVIIGDGTVLDRASVVVAGDRILTVTDGPVPASGARRIDAAGRTVLPGLIDAHVHVTLGPGIRDSASLQAFIDRGTSGILREFLEHGVTTVRSTGDFWPSIGEVRDAIESGALQGPRLVVAGPVVTYRDAHPATTVCGGNAFCRSGAVAEVDDAESARSTVQRLASEGIDFVKVVSDSLLAPVQIPDAIMAAIIAQAHHEGLEVVGHVAEEEFIRSSATMGMDGFVHPPLRGLSPEQSERLASVLVERGTPLTTTGTAFLLYSGADMDEVYRKDSRVRQGVERGAGAIRALAEAGVQIVVGTDWCPCGPATMGTPHDALRAGAVTVTEMEMLGWGGMDPADILAAATVNAARALGLGSQLGTLEPDRYADIIVVDGDPLEDVQALRNVRLVIKGGAIVVER